MPATRNFPEPVEGVPSSTGIFPWGSTVMVWPAFRPSPDTTPGSGFKRYDLPARAARNTAMMEALADLPPIVISDLFGIQPRTAARWAAVAGENWSDYLAIRRPHSSTGPPAR